MRLASWPDQFERDPIVFAANGHQFPLTLIRADRQTTASTDWKFRVAELSAFPSGTRRASHRALVIFLFLKRNIYIYARYINVHIYALRAAFGSPVGGMFHGTRRQKKNRRSFRVTRMRIASTRFRVNSGSISRLVARGRYIHATRTRA